MGKETGIGYTVRRILPETVIHRIDAFKLRFSVVDATSLVDFVASCPSPAFRYHETENPHWKRWGKLFWGYYTDADSDARQLLVSEMSEKLRPYLQIVAAEMAWQANIAKDVPTQKPTRDQLESAEPFVEFLLLLRDQNTPDTSVYVNFQEEVRLNTVLPRSVKNRVLGLPDIEDQEETESVIDSV